MNWRRLSLAVAVLIGATDPAAQDRDVSTRAIVAAGAAYVADYQRRLTSILADELYTQEIVAQVPPDAEMRRTRSLRSEVFFMFAPASREWMAIRDVMAVDGQPVGERPDLQEALRTLQPREVAATFKTYNSRFNIGRTFRNFNEPSLSLLVLDEHHRRRFSFDRTRVERAGGDVLVTLAFKENDSPTLIYDLKHGRVFSKGELVVEAATGRVRRTVLSARIRDVQLNLTTEYVLEPRLGIWVPATFREQYEYGVRPAGGFDSTSQPLWQRAEYERIVCEATYSNYRRFETSVRIK